VDTPFDDSANNLAIVLSTVAVAIVVLAIAIYCLVKYIRSRNEDNEKLHRSQSYVVEDVE